MYLWVFLYSKHNCSSFMENGHANMYAYIQMCLDALLCSWIHTYIHMNMYIHTDFYAHECIHTHIRTCIYLHTGVPMGLSHREHNRSSFMENGSSPFHGIFTGFQGYESEQVLCVLMYTYIHTYIYVYMYIYIYIYIFEFLSRRI